jgi:hypothetical protein
MRAESLSEAAIAGELEAIAARLEALAASGRDAPTIGPELGSIRAQLRILAEQNAEVGARLAVSLGLETPPVQ